MFADDLLAEFESLAIEILGLGIILELVVNQAQPVQIVDAPSRALAQDRLMNFQRLLRRRQGVRIFLRLVELGCLVGQLVGLGHALTLGGVETGQGRDVGQVQACINGPPVLVAVKLAKHQQFFAPRLDGGRVILSPFLQPPQPIQRRTNVVVEIAEYLAVEGQYLLDRSDGLVELARVAQLFDLAHEPVALRESELALLRRQHVRDDGGKVFLGLDCLGMNLSQTALIDADGLLEMPSRGRVVFLVPQQVAQGNVNDSDVGMVGNEDFLVDRQGFLEEGAGLGAVALLTQGRAADKESHRRIGMFIPQHPPANVQNLLGQSRGLGALALLQQRGRARK